MQVPYHLPAHKTFLAGATGEGVWSCSHGLHRWSVMPAWAMVGERPGAEQVVTSLRQEDEGL